MQSLLSKEQKQVYSEKTTTPSNVSQVPLLSSMHHPTDLPDFSFRLLPPPSPYRPTSPLHLTHGACWLLTHTLSFTAHFQFDPPQSPTDLTPPSHTISHFSTVSCCCLLLPWMAQKGVQNRRKQTGRTASTEFNKAAVAQPLASLSACRPPAQQRPCPSSSSQHMQHFQQ